MKSCIYTGWVRHHRFLPKEHRFQYSVSMMLLDLGELDQIFRKKWFWSVQRPNLVSFWRKDHCGNPEEPLDQSVRKLVAERTGKEPSGSIRLLTNLRYFGFAMNPVSFYYCYDRDDRLENVVAEVNNTPWGEQHCYVFPVEKRNRTVHRFEFSKEFHVSPFMGMDQEYDWRIGEPRSRLVVHMKNLEKKATMLHATLSLKQQPLTTGNLTKNLIRFPFMTGKVFAGIYWNALRLYLKKIPFYPHPAKQHNSKSESAESRRPKNSTAPLTTSHSPVTTPESKTGSL